MTLGRRKHFCSPSDQRVSVKISSACSDFNTYGASNRRPSEGSLQSSMRSYRLGLSSLRPGLSSLRPGLSSLRPLYTRRTFISSPPSLYFFFFLTFSHSKNPHSYFFSRDRVRPRRGNIRLKDRKQNNKKKGRKKPILRTTAPTAKPMQYTPPR